MVTKDWEYVGDSPLLFPFWDEEATHLLEGGGDYVVHVGIGDMISTFSVCLSLFLLSTVCKQLVAFLCRRRRISEEMSCE